MEARQDADNLAWDRSDELWLVAIRQIRLSSTCRKIESFAKRILGQSAVFVAPLIVGGFNVLYPIRIEGSADGFLVRMPCGNQAVFSEEKSLAEVATMACIAEQTHLSIPTVFYHGVDSELGPYMIIQDLVSRRGMGQALEAPRDDPNETAILDPSISEEKLKRLYVRIARCLLQFTQPTFPRIGALAKLESGRYAVARRPITQNMINMVQLSNIPKTVFPAEEATYQSANDWYVALAEMQIATLLFQHNDMVSSEDDCKTKYVVRQLFRRLAKDGRLATFGFSDDTWSAWSKKGYAKLPAPDNSGSFRLWSDDFRPTNILVDENDQVLAAIDWECSYVAPTQFALDPPWWLLLDVPEMWDAGIEDWVSNYERRLQTWLQALEEAERDMAPGSFLLSAYMRESWTTGRFWLNYASRKSWALDTIYWKYLDEKFFGEREKDIPFEELWKVRINLLTEEEQVAMHLMVRTKMEESKARILVQWEAEEARKRLSSFLFD